MRMSADPPPPENFLERIFRQLSQNPGTTFLQEVSGGKGPSATGGELLSLITEAHTFLRTTHLKRGDRCALHAANSLKWIALDLAIMAEGLIAVPLYSRQAASELVAMLRDCGPVLVISGDGTLRDAIAAEWPEHPRIVIVDEIFPEPAAPNLLTEPPAALAANDPVTII